MQRPLRTALICIAALVAMPGQGVGAAWTQPAGATFLSVSTSVLDPDDSSAVREATTSAFVEHGLVEGFTVGGTLEWKFDLDRAFAPDPDTGETSLPSALSAAAFARYRLREGPAGDPLSVQLGFILPIEEPAPSTGIFAEERALDMRLLYGRGFSTGWGDGWVGAETALRHPLDNGANEIRLDLTAGFRPFPRALVYIQSFTTIGLRNPGAGGSDFDEWKLAPSVGFDLGKVTMVGSVERTVVGRNVDDGTRFRLSFWRQF